MNIDPDTQAWVCIEDLDAAQREAEAQVLLSLYYDVEDERNPETKRLMSASLHRVAQTLLAKTRSECQKMRDSIATKHLSTHGGDVKL